MYKKVEELKTDWRYLKRPVFAHDRHDRYAGKKLAICMMYSFSQHKNRINLFIIATNK